jgi:hypothetical protein
VVILTILGFFKRKEKKNREKELSRYRSQKYYWAHREEILQKRKNNF